MLLTLFALIVFAGNTSAQDVTGRVLDASTGEGLPNTNVQVEGTLRGTVTNLEGEFRMRLNETPAVLLVRYIGYESQRIPIASGGPFDVTVRLQPVTYELEGVVVSGEEPGTRIMRLVIERKQAWREALESYRVDAYNRYTVANDTGIVMINETLTEVFWDKDRGSREIVKAQRKSANLNYEDALPDEPYILNLYDDDVEVGEHRFVGVTHPDALDVYDFRLEGTRVLDSLAVYDISVQPRHSTSTAFVGRVAVLDSAFALLEAHLTPGKSFIFPVPIQKYELTLSQQFSNFGRDFWLPVDFRRQTRLKISWGFLLTLPELHIDQVSRLTDYDVNVPVPDSLYKGKEYSIRDSLAMAAKIMDPASVVPLTAREDSAFAAIDSTLSFRKAFRPRGLMASSVRFGEGEERDKLKLRPQIRRNRVEDYRLGVAAGRQFGKLWLEAEGAYLTGPDEGSYGGGARLQMLPTLTLGAGYHDTFASRSSLWTEATDRSDFASVVTGSNQFDWYRNRRFFAIATVEVLRSELGLRLNREEHRSHFVAGVASAFGEPDDRVNPSIEDGLLTSIGARLSVGETILAGVTGGNHLVLYAEHSGLLGGDFRFTQLSGILDLRAETFARRRFIPNTLDVRIAAGASLGDLPIQRTSLIEGSAAFLEPVYFGRFGSLRTLEHRAYQGDRHAGVFWEHSFRSLPFELMGWRWAARQGYGIIIHGAHARTWLSQRLKDEIGYPGAAPDSFHHEIGISLSGVFGLFRIDATQRLDKRDFTIGIGVARIL